MSVVNERRYKLNVQCSFREVAVFTTSVPLVRKITVSRRRRWRSRDSTGV